MASNKSYPVDNELDSLLRLREGGGPAADCLIPPEIDNDEEEIAKEMAEHHHQMEEKKKQIRKALSFSTAMEPGHKRDHDAVNQLEELPEFESESWRSPAKKRIKVGSPLTDGETGTGVFQRIPRGAFQEVTGAMGRRVYVKKKASTSLEWTAPEDMLTRRSTTAHLCHVPFSDLMDEAISLQSSTVGSEASMTAVNDGETRADSSQAELWVEKYSPNRYLDLLSDDHTNKTLLKWLRYWDKHVFGVAVKPPKAREPVFPNQKKPSPVEPEEVLDEGGRPLQKIALLHGQPGLGKTTLAHIVARHAGYNVVEINASDDRALQTFKNRVEAATQMRSVMGADKKPNCLIIDEIDGSPVATINYLVNLISAGKGKPGRRNKNAMEPLQKPIIAICNSLYTPALRALRQIAMVIPFPPTEPTRLASRLQEIARAEGVDADLSTLLALCSKTSNDVRSCLSFLQFKGSQKRIRLVDVEKSSLGQKDAHKSHFQAWREIFEISRAMKKRLIGNKMVEESCQEPSVRFSSIMETIQSCGDYSKVMDGTFENYLGMKFKDSSFENVLFGLDWFSFFDIVNHQIQRTQNYALMPYLPFTFVSANFSFASRNVVKIAYPRSASEMKSALARRGQIVDAMQSDLCPAARAFASPSVLKHDVLPFLLEIININLTRPNAQLFTKQEKRDVASTVATMVAYNLSYVQERDTDGNYDYKLDPDVEDLTHFPGLKRRRPLSYATKQLLAYEIQLEQMRGEDSGSVPSNSAGGRAAKANNGRESTLLKQSIRDNGEENNKKSTLKSADMLEDRGPVDFFGRPLVVLQQKQKGADDDGKSLELASNIIFSFKEGFNNAVRKNIRLGDLM